jgi:hypothetical protein
MGHSEADELDLSRRSFLGWGAGLLAAAALPGVLVLSASPAAAATVSPYALATWTALAGKSVKASAAGSTASLKVTKVTPMVASGTEKVTGDAFAVVFSAPRLLSAGIYAVTVPSVGTIALYLEGVDATTARMLINRRVPTGA